MSQITIATTPQGFMRTVTQQSVLNAVASKMGLDPSTNLETNVATAYLEYIDERCREAWELWDWTELLINDQRAFAPGWVQASSYAGESVVFDWTNGTLQYYEAAAGGVPGGTLLTNTTYWEVQANPGLPLTVPNYGQLGHNPVVTLPEIGTVLGVYSNDPYQNSVPRPVPYTRTALGLTIYPSYTTWASSPVVLAGGAVTYPYINLNTIFILHRQAYPGYATQPWVSGQLYTAGNLVYYQTDTYVNILATSTTAPGNVAYWTLVPFPYVLAEFVKQAAYCDALIEDGQQEKATARLPNAYARLYNEFDKQTLQQALTQRYSVLISSCRN